MEFEGMPLISELSNSESLSRYAKNAEDFLLSHSWCKETICGHLAFGWEEFIGIFLFQIIPNRANVDDTLWVISGGSPPAYIVYEENPLPSDALSGYIYEMRRWIKAVNAGESVENLMPVRINDSFELVSPTKGFVELIDTQIKFIEIELMPELKELGL